MSLLGAKEVISENISGDSLPGEMEEGVLVLCRSGSRWAWRCPGCVVPPTAIAPTQSSLFYVCVLTLTPEKLHKNISKHVSALID